MEPRSEPSRSPNAGGHREFLWNGRTCRGTELHRAAIEGDVVAAKQALDAAASSSIAVQDRFTYETIFQSKVQEGSGNAIHLAASRGHVEVVKLLLERKADLNASVTRDGKNHYDVLHAAMFAEGRGGFLNMVEYLFEAKAAMSKNLDGKYPLHVAFQTGNVPVIKLLRQYLALDGVTESDYKDPKVPLPLRMGIMAGKMSEDQLADAAELMTQSLCVFIHDCPQCIPAFLNRYFDEKDIGPAELARNLTRLDIAEVLRESPEAACALLDRATGEPDCESKGWHPLPSRVSFAPRDARDHCRLLANPPPENLIAYENSSSWQFDGRKFEAPAWHTNWTDRSFGRPFIDADIGVCHVPDIICAEVFSALCCDANSDDLSFYENDVIYSAIEHTYWHGCARVDLTQVMFSFWGLCLILFETYLMHDIRTQDFDSGSSHGVEDEASSSASGRLLVSINFVAAKGAVDIVQEVVQLAGCWFIGRKKDYLRLDNLTDMFFACMPMYLFIDPGSRVVMLATIFLYWSRLLECFTSAELIGRELLPIRNLARGLKPTLSVTAVAFGAFTHAFYSLRGQGKEKFWPDTFFSSFSTLITAALPAKPNIDWLELLTVYASILFFTVFILNIFIGVISEMYIVEKENVRLNFRQLRAGSCLQYLLRARIMPCRLCSKVTSFIVIIITTMVAVAVQGFYLVVREGADQTWIGGSLFFCQLIIVLASYQNPSAAWVVNAHSLQDNCFVWFCKKKKINEEGEVVKSVRELLGKVEGLKL
ncbi:unnamed protein product [Polarella glacialis]|uniref:Ion transport domain-containing protein n=1 Tax=Polarella glacialis TaxID=89957 RepID=A0A813HFL6_POLGL|nr:unnamed protein product [Polarella glacialis]